MKENVGKVYITETVDVKKRGGGWGTVPAVWEIVEIKKRLDALEKSHNHKPIFDRLDKLDERIDIIGTAFLRETGRRSNGGSIVR
jgi:tetrahydromethanopterin S-methyltransferase subunit G